MIVSIHINNSSKKYYRQQGVATLVFSIIVLLLVTFVALYTSKSIITETKISNNSSRSVAAFEAAEAGVAIAMEGLTEGNNLSDINGTYEFFDDTGRVSSSVDVSVNSNMEITSVGWSDDKSSTRTIFVLAAKNSVIANVPENPWISRGSTNLTGNAKIYNQEGASTVWTGSSVTESGSTGTYIANPQDPNYPGCLEASFTCTPVTASFGGAGVDIVANDRTLSSLNQSEFFQNFFGYSISDFKSLFQPANTLSKGDFGEIVWIDGDYSFSEAQATYGCKIDNASSYDASIDINTSGKTQCEIDGGEIKPITLIVDGNLRVSKTMTFYGVIFVLGDLDAINAGANIIGSMMVDGDVAKANGQMVVWYNSDVIRATNDTPKPFILSGGWRDFSDPTL